MKHKINLSKVTGKYKDEILLSDAPELHSIVSLYELTKKLRFVTKYMYVLSTEQSESMYWVKGWVFGEEQYQMYQQLIREMKIDLLLK